MREKHVLKSFVGWNPTFAWSRNLYLPFFEGLAYKNRDLWLKAEASIYKLCDPLQELWVNCLHMPLRQISILALILNVHNITAIQLLESLFGWKN